MGILGELATRKTRLGVENRLTKAAATLLNVRVAAASETVRADDAHIGERQQAQHQPGLHALLESTFPRQLLRKLVQTETGRGTTQEFPCRQGCHAGVAPGTRAASPAFQVGQ